MPSQPEGKGPGKPIYWVPPTGIRFFFLLYDRSIYCCLVSVINVTTNEHDSWPSQSFLVKVVIKWQTLCSCYSHMYFRILTLLLSHGFLVSRIGRLGSVLRITAAKSLQPCPTLCDPIDSSPPGSPVPGILQARTLECHFLLQCMKVKSEREVDQSCPTLSNPMDCSLPGFSVHGIIQARTLECHFLLQCMKVESESEVT